MSLGPHIVIPNAQGSPVNGNSMAVNITSQASISPVMGRISYQAVWSGTSPVGTISIQGSNDYVLSSTGAVLNAGSWDTLTISYLGSPVQSVPVTGNTGNGIIDITTTGIYATRLVYTATSGTGSLTVTVFGKGP